MTTFKMISYTVFFGVFLLAGTFSAFSQNDIETVNDNAFEKQIRPGVVFSHDAHNEKAEIDDCTICHHMFEDGEKLDYEESIGMECSDCHFAEPQESMIDLIRVYHLQCSGCHVKQKAGPIICGECHRKR